jgi:hypothetical protein
LLSEEAVEAYQDPVFEQLFPAEIHNSGFVGETSYCDPPPQQEFDNLVASEIESVQQSLVPTETETFARTTSPNASNSTASETAQITASYFDTHSSSPLNCEPSQASLLAPPVEFPCDTCFRSFTRKCDLK